MGALETGCTFSLSNLCDCDLYENFVFFWHVPTAVIQS